MGIELNALGDRVFVAVLNGVLQGVVLTGLVYLALRLMPRSNAATRHAVWLCTLFLLVGLVAAHCIIGVDWGLSKSEKPTDREPLRQLVTNARLDAPGHDGPERLWDVAGSLPAPGGKAAEIACDPSNQELALVFVLPPWEVAAPLASSVATRNITPDNSPEPRAIDPMEPATVAANPGEPSWLAGLKQRLTSSAPVMAPLESRIARILGRAVLGGCAVVALVRLVGLGLGLYQIRRLKRHSLPVAVSVSELFERITAPLRLTRKVGLKTSPTQASVLLGFCHPVILLPDEVMADASVAEQILRHELAHVARRDDWANLAQNLILAAIPFHPAAWWVCRRLSLEREIACDDHVLQSGGHPRTYALLLAELATRLQRRIPALAPGASNHQTQLQQRIDMILNTRRNRSPRLGATALALVSSVAAVLTVAAIVAAPRIVLAQSDSTSGAVTATAAPEPPEPAAAPEVAVVAAPAAGAASVYYTPAAGAPVAVPLVANQPVGLDAGVKYKPGTLQVKVDPTTGLAVATRPTISLAPGRVSLAAPAPVALVATASPVSEPQPVKEPRPPRAPRGRGQDASVEERLERLERMVESLMDHKGAVGFSYKPAAGASSGGDLKELARIEAQAWRQAEIARDQALKSVEMERVKEEAKRMAADAAKHAAEFERSGKTLGKTSSDLKGQPRIPAEDLRKEIESLERERDRLSRQIERLQRNRERLDDKPEAPDAKLDETAR